MSSLDRDLTELSNEELENRYQILRSRILGRLRKPCAGRFNHYGEDIEFSFLDDVRRGKMMISALRKSAFNEIDRFYYVGLDEELEWAEESVRNAWRRQDEALEKAKINKGSPCEELHPNQTTL